MKTSFSTAARARLAACIILSVLCVSLPAWAWKPITHVYLAEKARAELMAQNGSISLNQVDFYNRQQAGLIGTYAVSSSIYQALRDYPAYYRAGVLGPDAYPDLLFGQSVIHPAREDSGSDSDPWMRHLYTRASTPQQRAFVMGFLSHAAGDMFGHTFINHYARGPFNFADGNAKRHVVAEGHVGRRTPALSDYSIDTSAVNTFIYDNMIDARRSRDGSWSNDVWKLTRNTQSASLPRLFTELRAGLEDKIDGYYEHVRWLKQKYKENADRCTWYRPGACLKAAYYKALLIAYNVIAGLPVYYMEAWVRDINRGLKAWPAASTDVARALFMQTNHKADIDTAKAVVGTYKQRYLCSMMGAPDAICTLSAIIENIISAITFKIDLFKALKEAILNYVVKKATGEELDYWKTLMDPEPYQVDQEVPANPANTPYSSQQLDQLMWVNGAGHFDMFRFAPAYNTYAAIKMSFLDTRPQWQSVLGAVGSSPSDAMMNGYDAPNGFNGQFLLGFIRSMDWDNQFAVPKKMFIAQDCMLYTRFFMQQTGDLYDNNTGDAVEDALRLNQLKAWCGVGGNKLTYNASATGSSTANFVTRNIPLMAGETITLGTCGVAGASGTGDTYLRLFSPWGTEVVANDDACGGALSNFAYTVPAGASGTYQLRAGCWSSTSCGGTAVWNIRGSFSYSASNTSSATVNTSNRDLSLVEGQRLKVGTCDVTGASGTGDTYLRLFTAAGAQVTYNDDACGGLLSTFEYVVPWGTNGTHQLRAGCWSSNSCNGTVSYLLTDASL
ncbi:MAG TPA: hypothetical protein VFZ09_00855 [Archangium sp.]|uniref:hypothetical protein n=1 Tax=Archangium sp. TaxID=1872627 RepID=UPI002E352183|nr:hypothetical protein [Archangium sp.]HEX5744756.1 hypothetical protein [Archangium sp.]